MGDATPTARPDDGRGAFGHEQFRKSIEFHPLGAFRVISRPEIAAQHSAVEIDQNVVVFAAAGLIGHQALKHSSDFVCRDGQSGLFGYFADESLFQALSHLNDPAW
jgi:hypothetical protein